MAHSAQIETRPFRSPAIPIRLDEIIAQGQSTDIPPKISENVQILRTGNFKHPEYGKFSITSEMLDSMVRNFNEKIRGIDISIDYAHESDKVAAGWIKELYLSDDRESLWAKVDWTPRGQRVLSDKEYRYLSADFSFDYQNNETSKKYGPTLFGAGLTNRPVIKEMEPVVELSEVKQGASQMDEKDKKIKQLEEQVADLQKQIAAPKVDPKVKAADDNSDVQSQLDDMKKRLAALEDFMNQDKADDAVESADKKKELSEREKEFRVLLSEGKAVAAQKEAYLKGDMLKFAELHQKVHTKNSGHGSGGKDADLSGTPDEQVLKLAQSAIKDGKCKSLGDAITLVLSENTELRKAYESKPLAEAQNEN